jgi:hypothetical protein
VKLLERKTEGIVHVPTPFGRLALGLVCPKVLETCPKTPSTILVAAGNVVRAGKLF